MELLDIFNEKQSQQPKDSNAFFQIDGDSPSKIMPDEDIEQIRCIAMRHMPSNLSPDYLTSFFEMLGLAKVKLASYFSHKIVNCGFRSFLGYRIEGLSITVETDFGRRITTAEAKDENELLFWVMYEITKDCANHYEQFYRERNLRDWRYVRSGYVRSGVVDGHFMYTENTNYKYNAIEDHRKVLFEKHIGAMAYLFTIESVASLISFYTRLMNGGFTSPHWAFDTNLMEFVEISSSRKIDNKHIEHPQPYEIRR